MILLAAPVSLRVEEVSLSHRDDKSTSCYPRSESTWGCHCSSHASRQVRVSCKGSLGKRLQVAIRHTSFLLASVLPGSGLHVHTMALMSSTILALVTHSND